MPHKDKAASLFRQTTSKPATPHDRTAAAAREIIETEAARRADLTASLKAARLARDAGKDATDAPPAFDKKST
ncbi:hypothetical protein [Celeribacter ethanolicus]|uniref:hypothetical protein n=1 Tax=Celeribacter ethanolicus TaxID=1758178 RepID=UPI000836A814|nr:hypothetical protein [Celeribacter ethanolicus]